MCFRDYQCLIKVFGTVFVNRLFVRSKKKIGQISLLLDYLGFVLLVFSYGLGSHGKSLYHQVPPFERIFSKHSSWPFANPTYCVC